MRGFTLWPLLQIIGLIFQGIPATAAGTHGQGSALGQIGQDKQVTLVTERKQVWIQCRSARANQSIPAGFCEKLLAGFAMITGQQVNTDPDVPDQMAALIVIVDQTKGRRAAITLIAGSGQNGTFVENQRQILRLGSVDAPLRAAAAQALIYPMVGLLPAVP